MQDQSILNAAVIGMLAGLAAFCASCAFAVWRRRNRSASDRQRSFASTLAKAMAVAAVFTAMLGLAYQESARREGALRAEDVLTIRAPKDMKPAFLTEDAQVAGGDVLARFEAPEREASVEGLRLQCQALQAQWKTLENQPLELDAELVRQHQRTIADLRQYRTSLDQLIPARETIRRLRLEDRFEKNQRIRDVEKQLISRRSQLTQSRAHLAYLREVDRTTQSAGTRDAVTTMEMLKTASELEIGEAEITKLTDEVEALERELAELRRERDAYAALMTEQEESFSGKIRRTVETMQRAEQREVAIVAQLAEDRRRAEARRLSELHRIGFEVEQAQAGMEGLERMLTIHAPFDGTVLYRATAPKMAYNEAPLLVLGSGEGFVARIRVPRREAGPLRRAGRVILESRDAAVQRRFAGTVKAIRELPDEDAYVLAELQCHPPHESIQQLAREELVSLKLRWRPPLHTQPLFLTVGLLVLVAAGAAGWSLRTARTHEPAENPDEVAVGQGTEAPASPPSPGLVLEAEQMAEYGADGGLLRALGGRLGRALRRGRIPDELLCSLEWALDRHHVRAVRLVRQGLHDDDPESTLDHARGLLDAMPWEQQEEGADASRAADHDRRLARVLHTLVPALRGSIEDGVLVGESAARQRDS